MTDLQTISGLPVSLTDDGHLEFGEGLPQVEPGVRKFSDMIPVLMDPNAKNSLSQEEMYYMYRDVHMPEHEADMRAKGLRYDLTVLLPGKLGEEFNKTVGHYHPLVPGSNLAYPELYEVLHGHALFLIQKLDETGKEVVDIQAIKAKPGDKIIYPPGYGHIIVNIGDEPVVTSNWVAGEFSSDYEPIREKKGMAYYVVSDGDDGIKFVPNATYEFTPPIKVSSIGQSGWGFNKEEPMYPAGVKSLDSLKFLTNPEILTQG